MYAENLISTPEAQADFYPTPKELGKKMVQGIDLGFISTVLEPSAGKGDLIRCLAEKVIAQDRDGIHCSWAGCAALPDAQWADG